MPNFYDQIARAASRFPDRAAVEMAGDDQPRLTYADLAALTARMATWLTTAAGVGRGDRVAILAANDARWVAAYLGILRAGAVAVPLDTAYTARQVQTVLTDCQARVILTSERLEPAAVDAISGTHPVRCARLDMALDGYAADPSVAPMQDGDAAAILYTSGTTADPKGVVLTHGNLEAERASAFAVVRVTEEDAVLGVLPLFHALAQMANLLLPLAAGARVVFLPTVNSATLLGALQTHGITIFACVPQFFYLIHQRVMSEVAARGSLARRIVGLLVGTIGWLRDHTGLNPGPRIFARVHLAFGPRMRMLITGGSRFDPVIARDLYGMGLTLLNGYGLTETSGAATLMRPGDRFTTSVGHPLPGVEVRIEPDAAATADGTTAPDAGEILIRGPVVMREYFNRPDATATTLDQGWLRTGDLGRLDRDGRVYITGRKKEVIVLSSGKNLYPEEIEAHYRQSPFIKELCVLGVSEPGVPSAERLHAVVVPDDDALRARGIVNLKELIRFEIEGLAVQLPAHKRILSYDISTEALPRTTTGKLKRTEVERRRQASAATVAVGRTASPDDAAWQEDQTRRPLIETLCERLDRASVHPDDNLELDLHLDSMERVELLARLEQRQGTQVPPEVRATIFTVRQLIDAVLTAPVAHASPVTTRADGSQQEWATLLATAPDPGIATDLARPALRRAVTFWMLLRVVAVLMRVSWRVDIRGREHLPAQGPYLITPNHQAYLDGFLLATALPFGVLRQLFFVGASEYFDTTATRLLARAANIVPVDPDANLVNAMQAAATGLRLGKVLMLFPEGERTIDGTLKPFRKGAAILASHLDVPVVPVALDGLYDVWPRGRAVNWRLLLPWTRHRVTLTFGPPLRLGPVPYAAGTDRVREAVVALLGRRA